MNNDTKTCYMCDEPAIGSEHVPPRCFFPEQKDLGNGEDMRINLKTVPSCNLHNSGKSQEDQFFLNVVTSLDSINEVGRNHYLKKIRCQNERNSSIISRFADNAIYAEGKPAYLMEIDRIDSFLEHFGYALYCSHYLRRWTGESIEYIPEFAARPSGTEEEKYHLETIKEIDILFNDADFHGENPSVFKYQVVELNDSVFMRAHFYEGCKIYFEFSIDE